MHIPDKALNVMRVLKAGGAREVLIVGGFVRDSILGVESKDVDIEVYGMDMGSVMRILRYDAGLDVNEVGASFGVLKVDNEIDVSVPRRENKIRIGHRGFGVDHDPDMSVEDAAARRDFTINSMAMRMDGTIIDPHHGRTDLDVGCLRATSPEAFVEDPLRVMRAMQFASRFRLWIHPDTEALCRSMAPQKVELPKERIWEEWKKWAVKGVKPSDGLMVLFYSHWLDPEIRRLHKVPQDKGWHPEGDVFAHTCHVVDAAAKIAEREHLDVNDRMVLMFAALCHDFGKVSTTEFIDGHWRARGHCEASVKPAQDFLRRIGAPMFVVDAVSKLVIEHLIHAGAQPTERAVRRLANRLHPSSVRMLGMLVEADHSGRPPLPAGNPFEPWVDMAVKLYVDKQKPLPILWGRHLVDVGMKPGPKMGVMLAAAFQAQMDGRFDNVDDGVNWVRGHFGS
jgi:tRNA nucleotidyltransferase (CCA-adding enzyme)